MPSGSYENKGGPKMNYYYFIQRENTFYLYESIDFIPVSLLSGPVYKCQQVHNGICKRFEVVQVIGSQEARD